MSSSSSLCLWKDLKVMINFYLVLFYVTLIMLSRQVQPGRPWLGLERELGWGQSFCRFGAAQKAVDSPGPWGRDPRVLTSLCCLPSGRQ